MMEKHLIGALILALVGVFLAISGAALAAILGDAVKYWGYKAVIGAETTLIVVLLFDAIVRRLDD